MFETIDSVAALKLLKFEAESYAWIDVRSEGEFAEERIQSFCNVPILNNEERRLVGICYKESGQQAAIQLGLALTESRKKNILEDFRKKTAGKTAIVTCWRGGLRSKFACEWMQQAGVEVLQLKGGYKDLRRALRTVLERSHAFIVIGGLTGSNKSGLLQKLPPENVIDLETQANHFGSAFGYHPMEDQPNQTNFENDLFFDFYFKTGNVFIEDESKMIGRVFVPPPIHERMQKAPVVWVEASPEQRAATIYDKYIRYFIHDKMIPNEFMKSFHLKALENLRKKLGDLLYRDLRAQMTTAYESREAIAHQEWIKRLLLQYYDKRYEHAFERSGRKKIFSGSLEECVQWISKNKEGDFS